MNKPKIMCLFCYVEREYYDDTEKELAEKFKFAEKLLKHKWYCPLFKFIYKWTGKKII